MTQKKDKKDVDKDNINEHNDDTDVVFDDIDEEGKSLASIKKIRDKLRLCEQEKKELLDGWQRCKADAVNNKKRDEEYRLAAIQAAKEDTLLAMLPVIDSFEMAFSHEEALKNIDPNWVAGMQNIQNQLISIFSDYGITQIAPLDERFDPQKHESVEVREVEDEQNDDKILKVVQKGYVINDKVLRAAKVVVGTYKKSNCK